ncbi:MAG: hypothetical protein IRZ09_00685 [Variibacter sp.]|nr:hypothetical protein [Variibacter sp.]
MKHRPLDEIKNEANVTTLAPYAPKSARTLRRERLERFATVLERHEGPVRLLSRIEYLPESERMRLRSDDSPLAIAYRDPVLREDGLASDRLGDAMTFFDLTLGEAHHLLCDCHYTGAVTPRIVAARARSLAQRMSWGEVWTKIRSALAFR